MSAPGAHSAEPIPPRSDRAALVQAWVQALRNQASSAQLQALAPLSDAEAARVMALLRDDAHAPQPGPWPSATAAAKPKDADTGIAPGHFTPRITLMTLGRGDGLLNCSRHHLLPHPARPGLARLGRPAQLLRAGVRGFPQLIADLVQRLTGTATARCRHAQGAHGNTRKKRK